MAVAHDQGGPRRGPVGTAVALAAFWAACLAAAPTPVAAQGAVKSTFGDWQMRCETPAGAKSEQCAIVQSVQAEDKPNVSLVVIILKTADGRSRLLRVIAPLGVLLPSGLGLKIDATDVGRAGFVRCLPSGCIAEVVMDEDLLGKLRNGQAATFIVFQTPEEGIGIPVSLEGFGKAFDSLP
jgi:invasion protein IalB